MTPYEIMLSESQERMLLVGERGRAGELLKVFKKWGLDAVVIGRVTDDGQVRVLNCNQVAAEIPAHALAEEGPVYERPVGSPPVPRAEKLATFSPEATDLTPNFQRLLASPAIASKCWIIDSYDHMVQTNTRVAPNAGDAAVLRIKGTKRALALSVDCNGRWCWLSPKTGAMHAVAEAARNVACSGARPVAATNCLNFGNPEKPEVMWQFSESIDGIAEACRVLGTPITGGNVSFYNETLGQPIYPTPVIGILGILEDASHALGCAFAGAGDFVILLDAQRPGAAPNPAATTQHEFSSSEYSKSILGVVAGAPPAIDLHAEKRLIDCLVELAAQNVIASAHDISDGGLAITLAECCFASEGLSSRIDLESEEPAEVALFGERGARAIVSISPSSLAQLATLAAQYHVRAQEIGTVTRGEFRIQLNGTARIAAPVSSLRDQWANSLERALRIQ